MNGFPQRQSNKKILFFKTSAAVANDDIILQDDYEHPYKPHTSYLYCMSCYTDTITWWSTSLYYKEPTDYK